ncbi:MAG TPA: site-specific integrase [Candidatus Polarisedimenticolia bacterium]|jgi:integrase|nr:site-specific integrase [Candidatus Polarisedimenticolia bacterium]
MSDRKDPKKWYGGGMYSRTPTRGPAKGTEVFYGKVWIKSERRRRHFLLGPGFLQAKKKLAGIYADPEKALVELTRRRVTVRTFEAILDEFLEKYRSRAGTSDYYRVVLKPARAFFGKKPIMEITVDTIDRYLASRRGERTKGVPRKVNEEIVMVGAGRRKVGEASLRKEIIAMGTVFRWAERRGLAGRNPIARVEKPKDPAERSIAILYPEQEKLLEEKCPAWAWDVAEWALYSGMRRGEVLALRWRDVDRARGVIHVLGGKTGKSRIVPLTLSKRLGAFLDRHPRRTDTDLLFHETNGSPLDVDRLDSALEGAAAAAGVPKERGVLWNRLRHTWATRLAQSGISVLEISKLMGNSVAICEKHYAAYLPGAHERLAGILDAPPVEKKEPPKEPLQDVKVGA